MSRDRRMSDPRMAEQIRMADQRLSELHARMALPGRLRQQQYVYMGQQQMIKHRQEMTYDDAVHGAARPMPSFRPQEGQCIPRPVPLDVAHHLLQAPMRVTLPSRATPREDGPISPRVLRTEPATARSFQVKLDLAPRLSLTKDESKCDTPPLQSCSPVSGSTMSPFSAYCPSPDTSPIRGSHQRCHEDPMQLMQAQFKLLGQDDKVKTFPLLVANVEANNTAAEGNVDTKPVEKASEDVSGSMILEKKKMSISTAASDDEERAKIVMTTESRVAEIYHLGSEVMASTNTGIEVRFATRVVDGFEVVVKTRKKMNSFKSAREERVWRVTTEAQLNMPIATTLCRLFDVLETPFTYYIVMERVRGHDLFEQLQKSRLPVVDLRGVIWQILHGLSLMHGRSRIHKDLKIENVMIDSNTTSTHYEKLKSSIVAKIIDFDTVVDWQPGLITTDVLGTDGYISPEAYSGDYSPASDIYAVGVIMYKVLTRRFPYKQDLFDDKPGENYVGSPAMNRIRERIKSEPIDFNWPPLDRMPVARNLVRQMLKVRPEDRPTADEALKHTWFTLEPKNLDVDSYTPRSPRRFVLKAPVTSNGGYPTTAVGA